MTNKRYALYVEEGKYLESWSEEKKKSNLQMTLTKQPHSLHLKKQIKKQTN
ncbi:hypothetical protein ACX6RG_002835 [Listeria monocytogenes]